MSILETLARRAKTAAPADTMQRERAIETQARAELQNSSYEPIRQVSCDVCQCVVTLSGRVPSFYMKQIAQTIVRPLLDGSLIIDNQLEVDRT
jgi:osmotically-inducible protein OsmY